MSEGIRICLLGAGPDTGNLGVSALCLSTLYGVARRLPGASVTVFDSGYGTRRSSIHVGEKTFVFACRGGWNSRRLYRPEAMWNIRASLLVRGLGNAGARAIRNAHAVLDASGGDSFSDLYGAKRFRGVTMLKRAAIAGGIPLVMLPQTYGPFAVQANRQLASKLVKRAAMAWARDARSFESLRGLLGEGFDPERHRCGVDVAFGLPAIRPRSELPAAAQAGVDSRPRVGFNISGLILRGGARAAEQYGLRADYGAVVSGLLRRLLSRSDARVLLVPHVHGDETALDADYYACKLVQRQLESESAGRLEVLPQSFNACETKWIISQLDWFGGTRMHSTIAALSSGVPSAAAAYSGKTVGVFETCGQGSHVADLRTLGTDEMIERLWDSWTRRDDARRDLRARLPAVIAQAEEQMDVICGCASGRPVRLTLAPS